MPTNLQPAYADAIERLRGDLRDEAELFHQAPVSLWLEDFSGVRELLSSWRAAGVTALREHLLADEARIKACTDRIRIIQVNQETLRLFEARDLDELMQHQDRIFRSEMLRHHVEELVQLWEGKTELFSSTVNYSLSGRRMDVQLRGRVMAGCEESWERVLFAIEDVSEREAARARVVKSESYARGLFHHSPVSLWVEDFSAIKALIDEVRLMGIEDFRVFTDVHREFVRRCMSEIRVLDVNRHTLEMFGAPDRDTLLARIGDVFRDNMEAHFQEQLVDLWDGKLFQLREVVNYRLDGTELHVHMQFSVLPGHEQDWSLVQVALTDITARKKAEAYLEYLGKHDVLTKLYNRSFYVEELNRLERKGPGPVTIVMIDLNGLKAANDRLGHAAGDALLRRVGEVLTKAVERPAYAARIGGDEFALLLPATDEQRAETMLEAIDNLVELNNQFYSSATLSLSLGAATSRPGERLEDVVKRADQRMFEMKREYYAAMEKQPEPPV